MVVGNRGLTAIEKQRILAHDKYQEAQNYMITALERIESAAYHIGLCNGVYVEDATNNLSRAANHMRTAYYLYKESFDILTSDDEDEQTIYQSEEEINEALCDPDIMGIHMYKTPCATCFYSQDPRSCPEDTVSCNQTTYFYKYVYNKTENY